MRRSAVALLCIGSLCTAASASSTAQMAAAKSGRIMMFGRSETFPRCGETVGLGPVEAASIQVGTVYYAGDSRVLVSHIDVMTVADDVVLGGSVVLRKGQVTCRAYNDRKDLPLGLQCGRVWIYIADCTVLH